MPSPALPGLREAARLIARRRLSPVELLEAALARIEALQPTLNAFISVSAEPARAAARRAEARLTRGRPRIADLPPLLGVPLSVKDLILTRDAPTTAGSRVFGDGLTGEGDAPVVARLRRAGAVILGKTNLHEVAYGVTTENEHFGPARNPWDPTRIVGGSSGGSAAAVAAGMGAGSVGTDTRGSIRIPAACCGITGLKPTYGLIPTDGVVPLAPSLDHVGPMARSVEDTALLLGAMQGSRKATARRLAAVDHRQRRLRIGVSEFYLRDAERPVVRAVEAALRAFRDLGWPVFEARLPTLEGALEASRVIVSAEALAFHDRFLRERPEAYGPRVRSRLESGRQLTAVELVRAEEQRVLLTAEYLRMFRGLDVLVGAALPVLPPRIGTTTIRLGGTDLPISEAFCRYNAPQNLTGVPALVLPGPMSAGLPIGVQLIAGWGREDLLLSAGAALQAATDWHLRFSR